MRGFDLIRWYFIKMPEYFQCIRLLKFFGNQVDKKKEA